MNDRHMGTFEKLGMYVVVNNVESPEGVRLA